MRCQTMLFLDSFNFMTNFLIRKKWKHASTIISGQFLSHHTSRKFASLTKLINKIKNKLNKLKCDDNKIKQNYKLLSREIYFSSTNSNSKHEMIISSIKQEAHSAPLITHHTHHAVKFKCTILYYNFLPKSMICWISHSSKLLFVSRSCRLWFFIFLFNFMTSVKKMLNIF